MSRKTKTLQSVAVELDMAIVEVSRLSKDAVWNFIALNIDRLRPIGFDGHQVICHRECRKEIEGIAK